MKHMDKNEYGVKYKIINNEKNTILRSLASDPPSTMGVLALFGEGSVWLDQKFSFK